MIHNLLLQKTTLIATLLITAHACFAHIAQDLELDALFATINYTHTHYGKNVLYTLLHNPTDNIKTLKARQNIINNLYHDAILSSSLCESLDILNNYAPYYERIIHKISPVEEAALSEFYFSSTYCKQWNYSPAKLELGQCAHFGNLFSSVAQHALTFALFTWGLGEEHVCDTHPAKKDKHHDHHHDEHAELKNDEHHGESLESKHTKPHKNKHKKCSARHDDNLIKAFFASPGVRQTFQLWHSVAQIQELYAFQAIVRNKLNALQSLQKEMIGLAHALKMIQCIYSSIKNNPNITNNLSHYKDLENICTKNTLSAKLTQLLTLLETPTFSGKPSVLSRPGNILAAYKLAHEVGHELAPAFKVIGEIDALISCTHLLKKHTHQTCTYTFAHYKENATTPHIAIHNFWHPLLSTDNSTIHFNSLELGSNTTPRNIIITAPNESGKSTNLKSITLCAYLAQTITIVPAQECSLTPYREIYSSIIMHDEIENNLSLFAAELTHAECLLEKVELLNDGEFMFIALDELFKSTHHEKGQKVAHALLKNLYESSNITSVVATHFEQLTMLASENINENNGNIVANYTVNNFILEPGIGSSGNSFDIVKKKRRNRLLQ